MTLPDFASLVERYGKAVVNVEVTSHPRTARNSFGPEDDPFFEFFRRFGIPVPIPQPDDRAPILRGSGSGFIVSPDGDILTNAHVVDNADEVRVRLTDRREFTAKVIGTDRRTDVAVLKIDAKNLPVVRIGDHTKLRPGEWVLAIGSPFGLENSVTAGIVSATSRAGVGESDVPFIQTDVAVNPGNSGGPLFNLRGEVVGINSMIFSRTGGYMGISFAIPIDVAINVRDQLIKTGHVVRGRIGVTVQNVDAALAQSFGLDRPRGALVSSVEKGAPAQRAGVKPGDVILKVDDRLIDRTSDLSNYIAGRKPGEESTLTVWRNGKEQTLTVRIAELKEQNGSSRRAGSNAEHGRLGLAVRPLTQDEQEAAGTDAGVRVVSATGAAAVAGVQRGDIVLAINSRRVRNAEDLREEVAKIPDGGVAALLILRNDAQIFIPVRVGKSE
ncbi:MAG TPA: DegQ family serine endoprotease [Steroidobacteraceae bacterium]|nr:DegQ family serine endoprotease [Steroidobacteraceae bacterium]